MRKNEFDELMRISSINLIVSDIKDPMGDWNVEINWVYVHDKSGEIYGGFTMPIKVSEAIEKGYLTEDDFKAIYKPLASLADKM